MSSLKKYLDEAGSLPDDILLGHVVLYTISDEPTDRKELEQWMTEAGLNLALLPPPPKEVDAYKKATSRAEDSTYPLDAKRTASILVRDKFSDDMKIVRQITREIRDSDRQLLDYTNIGEAVFYRNVKDHNSRVVPGTARMRVTANGTELEDGERDQLKEILDTIDQDYARYVNYLDGQKVRAMIRAYLKYLNAIEIKSGTYFVHSSRQDELQRLATVVAKMGGLCRMNLIPLVDLDSQREMVIAAFEREAAEELSEVVAEIAHLKATRKNVTEDAYMKVRRRYDDIMDRAKEYLTRFEIDQQQTAAAAELALTAMLDLQVAVIQNA